MEKLKIYDLVREGGADDIKVLEFPIQIDGNSSLSSVLTKRLSDYSSLIQRYMTDFPNDQITIISDFCEKLNEVVILVDKWKFDAAYANFCATMDSVYPIFDNSSSLWMYLPDDYVLPLYRARSGEHKDEGKEALFHVSYLSRKKCTSQRFSESEYPALYLSADKDTCNLEVLSESMKISTMAEYRVKRCVNPSLKLFDLTILNLPLDGVNKDTDYEFKGKSNERGGLAVHLLWPLLACCYVTVKNTNKCEKSDLKEYVIPQYLSRYLREKIDVSGIRYFTVRNPSLDSTSEKCTDYALFTREYDERGYDMTLFNKFDITIL